MMEYSQIKLLELITIHCIFIKHIILLKRFTAHHVPFEVAVDFNDEELCSAKTGTATCEFLVAASTSIAGSGGITGFSLCYTQGTK